MKRADRALYQAKENGRNRVVCIEISEAEDEPDAHTKSVIGALEHMSASPHRSAA